MNRNWFIIFLKFPYTSYLNLNVFSPWTLIAKILHSFTWNFSNLSNNKYNHFHALPVWTFNWHLKRFISTFFAYGKRNSRSPMLIPFKEENLISWMKSLQNFKLLVKCLHGIRKYQNSSTHEWIQKLFTWSVLSAFDRHFTKVYGIFLLKIFLALSFLKSVSSSP